MTEKVYESESCTDSEEESKMKTTSVHRPPATAVKKEPKDERKGPQERDSCSGQSQQTSVHYWLLPEEVTAVPGQGRSPASRACYLLCKFVRLAPCLKACLKALLCRHGTRELVLVLATKRESSRSRRQTIFEKLLHCNEFIKHNLWPA